jgi:hypothetical protein
MAQVREGLHGDVDAVLDVDVDETDAGAVLAMPDHHEGVAMVPAHQDLRRRLWGS